MNPRSQRTPVTTHRWRTVSPLAMMSRRSSTQVGEDRLQARDLLLEATSVGSWPGAGLWSTTLSQSLVDRRPVGCAKRVLEARDDL